MPITPADKERGKRLRDLRVARGMKSQDDVFGPERRTLVSDIERGKSKLKGAIIVEYAAALGLTPEIVWSVARGETTPADAAAMAPVATQGSQASPPAGGQDALDLLEEAARTLVECHDEISPEEAWLAVRGLRLKTSLAIYQEAYRRWKARAGSAVELETDGSSFPPPKAPTDIRRKVSPKRRR